MDRAPDAYEKLVDRLLNSPRYGGASGDVLVGSCEVRRLDGYRADHYRAEAWRYRDYVIRSFNTDKPYDQFIREQLAGDEIDLSNRDALVATMYFATASTSTTSATSRPSGRRCWLMLPNVTGDALLGLGLQCARCHDHKFDPITQRDYYRLQAFFTPLLQRASMPVGTLEQRTVFHEKQVAWAEATEAIRERLHTIEQPALLKQTTGEGFDKFIDKIKVMIRKRPEKRTAYERR